MLKMYNVAGKTAGSDEILLRSVSNTQVFGEVRHKANSSHFCSLYPHNCPLLLILLNKTY